MNKKAHILITDKHGNTQEVYGYAEACKRTELKNRTILGLLRTGKQSRSGYTFDYVNDYTPHVCVPTKRFTIKHKETGSTREFLGWEAICTFFGVTIPTIRLACARGYFRDYFVTEEKDVR